MLLRSPVAKELMLETLARSRLRHRYRLDDFVVMENHVHVLLWPEKGADLPYLVKWIPRTFTVSYNRVYGTSGHVWGNRYFSRPLWNYEQYMDVVEYIQRNPVKAYLIDRASDYEWSGFHHHLTARRDITTQPPWLSRGPLLLPPPDHPAPDTSGDNLVPGTPGAI